MFRKDSWPPDSKDEETIRNINSNSESSKGWDFSVGANSLCSQDLSRVSCPQHSTVALAYDTQTHSKDQLK